jgi:hypothetical protein
MLEGVLSRRWFKATDPKEEAGGQDLEGGMAIQS